jgi:hypothetical protein
LQIRVGRFDSGLRLQIARLCVFTHGLTASMVE